MSRIREISRLLRDVEDICQKCGVGEEDEKRKDMDPFDAAKLDFQEQKVEFEEVKNKTRRKKHRN